MFRFEDIFFFFFFSFVEERRRNRSLFRLDNLLIFPILLFLIPLDFTIYFLFFFLLETRKLNLDRKIQVYNIMKKQDR